MQNKKRLSYLESEWKRYPPITVKTLTPFEMKQEFSKLTAGAAAKADHFFLGGRIGQIVKSPLNESIEQISVVADGEEFFLKLNKLNENEATRTLVQDVIAPGDVILLKIFWMDVFTSGLFPKIENMAPTELTLLAPAIAKPLESEMTFKRAKQWELFLGLVRKCFEFLQFTEVRTPTLVPAPGLEPHIDVFGTEFSFGSARRNLYLPTSPEFHLKKVIALGLNRIFEFKESFRNGELSEHHQPEFLMLEWYRAFSNLDAIAKDVKGLLNYLKLHWPDPIKGWGALQELTMAQVFESYCDFELTPKTTRQELVGLAHEMGVHISDSDTWDEVFFKIFLESIEPNLGQTGPVIIRNYPPSQAAWARLTDDGWADRFEVYWRGVELANAFHELNDPVEQRRRFEAAKEERKRLGKPELPLDEELLQAIEGGFAPTGGIALGLDRLFMLLTDCATIEKTRFFSIKN